MSSGHEHDQGPKAFLRYLRHLPDMWRSDIDDAVVSELNPVAGETVVDIGSGIGAGVVPIAMTGARVIAVEPTSYMRFLLTARRLAQRARDNIEVRIGTAENVPVETSTAHAVMAVNSIHHWTDPKAAIKEISRVLVPGGRVLLVDEDFENPEHPWHEKWDDHGHDHKFEPADAELLIAELTAAGITPDECGPGLLADVPVLRFGGVKQ